MHKHYQWIILLRIEDISITEIVQSYKMQWSPTYTNSLVGCGYSVAYCSQLQALGSK